MHCLKTCNTASAATAATAAAAATVAMPSAASSFPRAAVDETSSFILPSPPPPLPCNAALQHEATAFLAKERAAEVLSASRAATQHGGRKGAADAAMTALDDGGGEWLDYPLFSASTATSTPYKKVNPCTCSTIIFDGWLRAVVLSIPGPSDVVSGHAHNSAYVGRGSHVSGAAPTTQPTSLSSSVSASPAFTDASQQKGVSREHTLYAALELLEAAARLLQRRLALSHSQHRLLQAYYNALEEDIDGTMYASAGTAAVGSSELKPTAFHRELRTRKREVPLQRYSAEQEELETRLEKVFYVLRKLEEVEGLSNSILIEGREAAHSSSAATDASAAVAKGASPFHRRGSHAATDMDSASDLDSALSDAAETDSSPQGFSGTTAAAAPSRRLVTIERRARRMRRQLTLPLAPAAITSRLRNELILSFSARVLALRDPAPFTPETHYDEHHNQGSLASPQVGHHHTHSISAFVEWYVQHILDPPAMSQLLSIVPHEYVVTTSCRLVYACEAHASLRASRALPDLGAVLLRAVIEGRADAMAQLILSSSISYGSALINPSSSATCFYAGLVSGQLEVIERLVEQQCWDAEALHVLLFVGAPWSRASATRGCHGYQKALLSRVWRVLRLAERALQGPGNEEDEVKGGDDPSTREDQPTTLRRNTLNSIASSGPGRSSDDSSGVPAGNGGSTGRDAAAVAVAALRDAGLLDASSEGDGLGILQTVSALLSPASFTNVVSSPVASAAKAAPAAATTSPACLHTNSGAMSPVCERGNACSHFDDGGVHAAGRVAFLGASPPPPAFLDGGLQKLRLLLAARNGMLQYETYQQDAQWAALLQQQQQQQHYQTARPVSLRMRASHNNMGQGNTLLRYGGASAGGNDQDGSGSHESTFAAVLQSGQLDALSPSAACPVRCQMCPAFSTPSLQRVDALSYGPLQPTTAVRASATTDETMMFDVMGEDEGVDVSLSDDDARSDAAGAAAASDAAAATAVKADAPRKKTEGGARERPVRARLLCADTAIETTPDTWHAYWCTPPVVSPPGTKRGSAEEDNAMGQGSWKSSAACLQAQRPARYSATLAIEDALEAALSAKQRRARHTLYGVGAPASVMEGGAAAGAKGSAGLIEMDVGEEEDGDVDAGDDVGHAPSSMLLSGYIRSSNSSRRSSDPLAVMRGDPRQASSSRSVYFEVHLALSYLLALYDASAPPSLSSKQETAGAAVCANSVVVGLCDDVVAAAANGCTRGPQQPYLVAHLGHTGDPAPRQKERASPGSAGVSVSVVAHHTRHGRSGGSAGDAAEAEVVYLAVWQHKGNAVTALTSEDGTRVLLRVDVPRCAYPAAKAAEPAKNSNDDLCNDDNGEEVMQKLGDDGDAAVPRISVDAGPGSYNNASTFLPTVTPVSTNDVRKAVSDAQARSGLQHGFVAPPLAIPQTTLVVGLLYTPATDVLRLRLNNFIYPGEIRMGMAAPASAADSLSVQNGNRSSGCLPARVYPAATLSLDEHGWERWYTRQTMMWARAQRWRSGVPEAPAYGAAARASTVSEASSASNGVRNMPGSALSSTVTVSNAVVRFAFDATDLLYGPPLRAAVPQKKGGGATLPHRRPRGGEPIALLDTACKFTQLLRTVTNVAAVAGLTSSMQLQQQQQGQTTAGVTVPSRSTDVMPPGIVNGGFAKPSSGSYAVPFFGSRDRRVRGALMGVQKLLNAPAVEGALFFPPVRIYRHSSHCPPQDLYPLPPPPKQPDEEGHTADGETDATVSAAAGAAAAPPSQPMRRQLGGGGGGGSGMQASLSPATGHPYWHEVIPENARLTPLCAALASRQPALAYAISVHPLTFFCDMASEGENRLQQQQRRTALYAACALGYADVLAVLLERIPVEEILSYFGLVIGGEARAALQQSYTKAETLFLRNYRLNTLSAQSTYAPVSLSTGGNATTSMTAKRHYGTNECQRALLDVSAIYSTTRSLYTPLHVALLGVIHENVDDADDDDDEGEREEEDLTNPADPLTKMTSSSSLYSAQVVRGLRRQTACATLLLNCLYDLLLVAPSRATSAEKVAMSSTAVLGRERWGKDAKSSPHSCRTNTNNDDGSGGGHECLRHGTQKRYATAGAKLLVDALNLQSRAGETALLLAVRHNNCHVAARLLRLGAQAACMDRVTHLFTLELACANRCSPIAEALLRAPSSPYTSSPVLLNHAGIATALCWCAVNNMHAVLQMLLQCDGIDVSAGFEGSTPLHLAITFGSEEAALALLSGTQPKTMLTTSDSDGKGRPKSRRTANTGESAACTLRCGEEGVKARQKRMAAVTAASEKPFMDVNVPHERTRCTALHLACERGQLRVVRALLQQWHAQLNIPAANTNYTPLLSALANGREDAALRVLEYSKDELRRGRAVLDLTAIDQNGDTALHLAARRGLVMAMEYMLVQFCEEEVARLAQLHPQLRASPAFLTATCIVPLHAVNKQGKSALLVAIQCDEADAAEVLVSTLLDRRDETAEDSEGGNRSSGVEGEASSSTASVASLSGGPLIDGTCMALHQAFKKRLYTVVELMLSAPSASHVFPASTAFRETVQQHHDAGRGIHVRTAHVAGRDAGNDKDGHATTHVTVQRRTSGQNRSSFVRLLLTRAAGPNISPSAALHLLLGGFVLPELCVYVSDVAAESAVLGVQHGTAMAHAELLMGYLQEYAGLVVAPTRMVSFCRDVWRCLQVWMVSKAAAAQSHQLQQRQRQQQQQQQQQLQREADSKAKKRKNVVRFQGGPVTVRVGTASPSATARKSAETREELQTPPMVWLCRALLPAAATAYMAGLRGGNPINQPSIPAAAVAAAAAHTNDEGNDDDSSHQRKREEHEVKKCGEALRSALNRKSLSLDIARTIRLYGRTAGGTRAIEEIEVLVRAYVTAKANARARQVRRRRTITTTATTTTTRSQAIASPLQDSASPSKTTQTVGEEEEEETSDSEERKAVEESMTNAAVMAANSEADVLRELIGNEVLFTTPIGFTVLQLAAALGLTKVTAFLVERFKLDPLYAPAQDLYAEAEADAGVSTGRLGNGLTVAKVNVGTRSSVMASASSPLFVSLNAAVAAAAIAATGREEEEEQLRVLNCYTVRAMAALVAATATAAPTPAGRAPTYITGPAPHGPSHASFSGEKSGGDDAHGHSDAGIVGDSAWFYWTPYRLAVRAGNVDVVRTLLSAADGAEKGTLEKKKSAAPLPDTQKQKPEADADVEHNRTTTHTPSPRLQRNRIVDFKEPGWVDRFQRTALQEQIALIASAAATPSSASSSSSAGSSSIRTATASGGGFAPGFTDATSPDGRGRAPVTSTLAAAADMVALLLHHGAQPNGLFDSTGSDAWMIALTGSSDEQQDRAGAGTLTELDGVSCGAGVGGCLNLLLHLRTPLLGCAPSLLTGKTSLKDAVSDATAERANAVLDEQLLQHRSTLLRKWKRLACMRGSSSSATREKLAIMKHYHLAAAAEGMTGEGDDGRSCATVDEGGFVFDEAEALCEEYRGVAHDSDSAVLSRATSSQLDDLSLSNLNRPTLASFLAFGQRGADLDGSGGGGGGDTLLSSGEQAFQSSLMWCEDDNPFSDPVGRGGSTPPVGHCKEKLIAALRLCYRVVLMFLCLDNAPQQLLRLLHVYTLDVVPVRARHPFSGDTVVTRLLRKARERLLTSGSTPTENEVDDITSRVTDGVSRMNLSGRTDQGHTSNESAAAATVGTGLTSTFSTSQQRAYRDPTADPGASILIHTSLSLIHTLPRLLNTASLGRATPSPTEAADCAALQSILFQPSFDDETALSLAARLAHVPLISSIVQSAASPSLLAEISNPKFDWGSPHNSRHASRRVSKEKPPLQSAVGKEPGLASSSLAVTRAPSRVFSLATNLTDAVVRVLLATRVYYPAHEIVTVRILLHCMPDETAYLAFLRWVYPNIHPLPALQLAMDHVDVAAHFLTSPDCMNALWTNLLYTHFTRQLDTVVHASAKAWNALLKVVLPGAPAVPIYLVLRGALRTPSDESDGGVRFSETAVRSISVASARSANTSTSVSRRKAAPRSKKAELTNWSYLVRRTTIFLQLMSMSIAETLAGKTAGGASHAGPSAAASLGLNVSEKRPNQAASHDVKDSTDRGSGGAATPVPASNTAAGVEEGRPLPATATRGLAGTLLLDALELAVRYDDKEVLSLLMQLHMPPVVMKYVHQVQQQQQQQQAASNSNFPLSVTMQTATARAMESVNSTILSTYPSFTGVRSMAQANNILCRLQRLLWWEAIQERHLDLIAVTAGAARTLRSLYSSRHSDVAALLSPMRYDRIDVHTGNPEGVVRVALQHMPSASLLSPQPSPGADPGASVTSVASLPEPLHTAAGASEGKRFHSTPPASTLRDTGEVISGDRTPSPPAPALQQPTSSLTPRSPTQADSEEEEHFMESCLQSNRLAPREERRRRVTMVTWGIGGSSCPIELPAGRESTFSAVVVNADGGDAATAENDSSAGQRQPDNAGRAPVRASPSPTSLMNTAVPRLPPAPSAAAADGVVEKAAPRMVAELVSVRPTVRTTSAMQPGTHKTISMAQSGSTPANTARVHVPTLRLPGTQGATSAPPSRALNPVYFMYLQLDWAMFSTLLLHSPQPSTATVDTILFLMEHRCALSVPVLDLFLSGLIVTTSHFVAEAPAADTSLHSSSSDNGDPSQRQRSFMSISEEADEDTQATTTVRLSLQYRTRRHRDTLLHLLVLHDQCQLAEYYLEYCYLFFVSHQIDPEPKNGRPGRFPIHERLQHGTNATLGSESRGSGNSRRSPPSAFPATPVAFLRLMLRVNVHGLTAFDYAHSPAMLQLLEWYGCVPPTYRPNPRLFRQVLSSSSVGSSGTAAGKDGHRSEASQPALPDEGARWALIGDDECNEDSSGGFSDDDDQYVFPNTKQGKHEHYQLRQRRKRELLQFFPVPRLVLATDNFVALLDPTGMELASTASPSLTTITTTAAATTDEDKREPNVSKSVLPLQRGERPQQHQLLQLQRANRHFTALLTMEKKQFQQAQRRREQQEMAKALLYEQVAAQPLLTVRQGTGNATGERGKGHSTTAAPSSAASAGRRGPANPPYLNRAVTASIRGKWEAQRNPRVSDTVLWHNALEAQRQSSSLTSYASLSGISGAGNARASRNDTRKGILPILLSEEVSLLHLGLCTFDDELVRLYGDLRPSTSSQQRMVPDVLSGTTSNSRDGRGGHGGEKDDISSNGAQRSINATAAAAQAPVQPSAYSRMLLPPALTGKAGQHESREQSPPSDNSGSGNGSNKHSVPAQKPTQRKSTLVSPGSRLSITVPATLATATTVKRTTTAAASAAATEAGPVSLAATAPPPLPPRLSYMDVVFLLECQQFVVFPLALPGVTDDDHPLDKDNTNAGDAEGGAAALAGSGRTLEDQRGESPANLHGPDDTAAVVQRCTGGDGHLGETRRRSRARSSSSAAAFVSGVANVSAPSQGPSRPRSRGEGQGRPATDAPLLRALLTRQAATMTDLVDITQHYYDLAILVSLTPMQLSGVAASGSGRRGAGGESGPTMRNFSERLINTRFKQFGSRLVATPPAPSSSSASAAATAAAAHPTIETVAVLHVPPFAVSDAVTAEAAHVLQQKQQQRGGPSTFQHSVRDGSTNTMGVAMTTVVGMPSTTSTAATNDPTVMAARVEEWVSRRWPAQRQLPANLMSVTKPADVAIDADLSVRTPSPSPSAFKLMSQRQSARSASARVGGGGGAVKAERVDDTLTPSSVLDHVAPVGGVATTTQQAMMRLLLKHFSAATGAQLSEQMGLIITPNYDVEEVGDAVAAQRMLAAKGSLLAPKKRR